MSSHLRERISPYQLERHLQKLLRDEFADGTLEDVGESTIGPARGGLQKVTSSQQVAGA